MKSTAFFAKFSLILFIKVVGGQHRDLIQNENFQETANSLVSQQQPIQTMVNNVHLFGNTMLSPENANQHQMLGRTNTPSPNLKQIPPDLQQQPLQVQQYLQLQKPLQAQKLLFSQESLQLEPPSQPPQLLQLQAQPLFQSQHPVQLQQALKTQQSQEPLRSYQPAQPLQSEQYLAQPLHRSQPLNLQQNFQVQEPVQIRPSFHPQQVSQGPQQALGLVQNSPLTHLESTNFLETTVTQQQNKNQPNSQIHVKWKSSNPQSILNIEKPHKRGLAEFVNNAQKSYDKSHEIPLLTYYVTPQQTASPSTGSVSNPGNFNSHSVSKIPHYNAKAEENPVMPPYNYIKPISEVQFSTLQRSGTSIPLPTSMLSVQNSQTPNSNMQTYYFNQLDADLNPNTFINQNAGFRYAQPSQLPLTVIRSQPKSIVPSQSAVLPSVPISVVSAPSISPNYVIPSGYPVGTIVAPVSQSSKSPTLKSFMPLIYNLLKERIASCGCRKQCLCECRNNSGDNELEVSSGYSSQKHYGCLDNDNLSVLNTVSEELGGTTYLRGRKNCERNGIVQSETLEEDDSDEEVDEDEDE